MAIDYGEKERAFVDSLKENTGRDLQEWMALIVGQGLPHRNDIIDWLRQRGFTFSKASWLERIHHNGGRLIYSDIATARPRVRRPRREQPTASMTPAAALPPAQEPARPTRPQSPPSPLDVSESDIDALLAKAKAYRPLAQLLLGQIKGRRPAVRLEPRDTFLIIADPAPFAALGIGAKELRLHLALGEHPTDNLLRKGAAGGGLGKGDALSHMVVLTDARQIDKRLLELVALAAVKVNG